MATTSDAESEEEHVFALIASHARTRPRIELWTTAVAAALNAGMLWWQHPSLSWLAAGFATVASYGTWGLLDRALGPRNPTDQAHAPRRRLRATRDLTAIAGTGLAAWTLLSFMAAAIGNWNH
jgi:hypothetical protein